MKPSPFWYLRDPPSTSSWDAGSRNIHQRLDGIPARSCNGVNPVSRTVSLTFQYLRHFLPVSKLTPPSLRAPNPSSNMRSHLTMRRSRMCSANRQPHSYPPHRPWDCAIDLLPGDTLSKGRVYPLSIPERKAMEEYIKEALQQVFIRPSTSPATSSFFVGKKDGGLRPCIDYRTLNDQTVKLPYILPLVLAALEELRGARIFSNWTSGVCTTSFVSGRGTSGRLRS